jgi:hypothetical protein
VNEPERLGVAVFVLVLLGGSYVAAVSVLAREYLLVATVAYITVATALLTRVVRSGG